MTVASGIRPTAWTATDTVPVVTSRRIAARLSGCSVEQFSGDRQAPIYELDLAAERVEAAAEAVAGEGRKLAASAFR